MQSILAQHFQPAAFVICTNACLADVIGNSILVDCMPSEEWNPACVYVYINITFEHHQQLKLQDEDSPYVNDRMLLCFALSRF